MANEKRLIDADAWKSYYTARKESLEVYDPYYDGYEDAIDHVDDWMDAQPTVDAVEVVHGRWETIEGREYLGCLCSNCQKWSDAKTNYCPNCGAKMDGDGNG